MAQSPSSSSPSGYLHTLCRQGNIAAIRSYLQGIEDLKQLEEQVGFLGYTPLHEATNGAQTSIVRLLLLYGANANAKANGFYTPLHIAASMDNVDCVIELLKHNADVTCKDEFGKTPYETAIINKSKKTAQILKTEEIKKAARENSLNLRDMLTSIRLSDVMLSCFKEALLEASRGGHVDAICSLIVTGGKHSLQLRDCISEALRFHFYEAAAMLLTCYGAKHDKRKLLKYLMGLEMTRVEEEQAFSELAHHDGMPRDALDKMRLFISDKDTFRIAVPIGLALQQRKKEAVGIILMSTNCSKEKKQVDWAKLALGEVDPPWLENVTWVEKFFLASNLLTTIPSNINILNKLCVLDLRRNQLRSIPARLLQLPSLRDLRLSENKIVELPKKCKWSPSLKTLNLNDNLLERLPRSMARAKLSILNLARNNLFEVSSCICEITTLQSLDLSANPRLTKLPYEMGRLTNIEFLKLEHLDQLTDPPEEIKQDGVKTIMYLRNSLRSSRAYYTVKLMLVGRAEQGKTTLMHRLMKDYTYNINSSTNGIAMDEFRYNRNAFGLFSNYPEYIFQIWDFGGQEDFYTTHQCFLSTLALYLLVWNLEEGESGIEKLRSWLDTISATASNTSVIIVGTHLDKVRKNKEAGFVERMHQLVKDLVELPKYKGQINVVYIKEVSCALDNREGIDDLRNTIYDAASALKKSGLGQVSVMGEMIPHSFWLVADAIQAKRQELRFMGRMPIMHKSEYEALVLDIIKNDEYDIEDTNDLRDVTQFMHERGILLHYDDPNQDLQDLYFIDPKWLCELMARIVTLRQVNPYILNGILNLANLPVLLKGELFAHHNYPQFIRLLNRFQIACSLDDDRVLIPSKLPEKKPEEATNVDLPFITLKRMHSLPCIPHGFWSRLISRLLFYMKDMLSGGETFTRKEYSSPFQLDPSCCRCPLVLESLTSDGPVEGDPELFVATEPSMGGSFENLYDSSGDYQGIRLFGSPRRQGTFINGRFFGFSDSEDRSSRSDSGYEYSSEDEDESRERTRQPLNATFPFSRGDSRRGRGVFKHNTDPGVRRDGKVGDVENATLKSDSAIPVFRKFCRQDDSDNTVHLDTPITSSLSEGASPTASLEQRRPTVTELIPSSPENELQGINSAGSIGGLEDSSRGSEEMNVTGVDDASFHEEVPRDSGTTISELKKTSFESYTKSNDCSRKRADQCCSSGDESGSAPYQSATSRPCTPDLFPGEVTDGCLLDSSSAYPTENPESPPLEALNTTGQQSRERTETNETIRCNESVSRENMPSDYTRCSSPSNSISSDNSGEGFLTSESRRSSISGMPDVTSEVETPLNVEGELSEVSHTSDLTLPGNHESLSCNTPCRTNQSKHHTPELFGESTHGKPSTSTLSASREPDPGKSATTGARRTNSRFSASHRPDCPFIEDFPIERLPQLPTDLAMLIDQGFLHCWKSGVCLRHPRLFLLLYCAPDPEDTDRQLVITEVSPCPQGRRVLSYVVDHIDTLIREWYQELSTTDGWRPKVRQLIPCVVCERLGLEPYKFTFTECQRQSSKSDMITCPKHPRLQVNLHQVAPDIMLHDVDADLLLSQDEITYEDTDSSTLGSGGFGKVVRGKCRGEAVAIKFYIQSDESEPLRHYREARKELNVLRRVRQHPFLISVIGVSLRPLCLVLELAEQGALTEILVQRKSIDRIVQFRIAYQIADALRFLHDLGVIYRDLKPENVLVWSLDEKDDLHVKLIDFGTANFATSTGLISYAGTPGIHAPEMLECANKEEYTPQVDVYSYAILLYKLITRLEPFEEYDSPPKVNAAVIAGERPKWQEVTVASFGLPSLTELMLRCWSAKPTRRPTTAEIVEQVRQPAFQCLLAKQPIPFQQQSVRHACHVPDCHDLWIACDSHAGNKIFIYNGRSLDMKFSFTIDTHQEQNYSFQIQCMHYMSPHVLIAVRGALDLINVYSTSNTSRYKCVTSMSFNEQVTCVTSNDEYLFVGLNDGKLRCILKSEMKKSDKKRSFISITVGRHRILSMTVAQDKLWVSTSRYIFRYFTKPCEMDAFEIDAMWYGGPVGLENNPQTQISLLRVSFDGKSVFSVCRSVLSKWDLNSIQNHFSVDCAAILQSLPSANTQIPLRESSDAVACITCVEPTRDAVWVGTASGHILIFDAVTAQLLTWFHPFDETRSLSLMHGPGPCGTEQSYVISAGKGLRPEGLGTRGVCVLSAERVREPPKEVPSRKVSDPKRKFSTGRKLRSPTPPCDEPDAAETNFIPPPKCAMIMWEVVSKSCFARIEAKSGRQRLPISDRNNNAGDDKSPKNGGEEHPQTSSQMGL